MVKLCLHKGGFEKIVLNASAPQQYREPIVTIAAPLSPVTESGEFRSIAPIPMQRWEDVYFRSGITHGDATCYVFERSELRSVPSPKKNGCDRDTDNDGNCDIHPWGCFP